MSYTLIICEKPSASKAIAQALADGEIKSFGEKNAVYFEFTHAGRRIFTVPAVGHLFTLKQKGKGWDYPVFDLEWVPSFTANKFAKFSEPYFKNMEKIAKDADDFIVATDFDDEGEIIGANILRFICNRNDAARMQFSTMTNEELIESYTHAKKHLEKNLAEAGYARHYMDWYFGINLTRALTNSIKAANKRFRILSTGRVQGPVLHMLAKHEKKIKAFKSDPFWLIELDLKVGGKIMKASYEKDKIFDKKVADDIEKKADAKSALVSDVKTKIMTQKPPVPYNTTSLLADIYRYFGYAPNQGMSIAEELYQKGYISYPRTSSEKLPPEIDYKKIIKALSKSYEKEAKELLAMKTLAPNEGKKKDSAHIAVYPTHQVPKRLGSKQQKVYDLIARRFLATFGDPAKRESQKIILDVNGLLFNFSGKKTIEPGWTSLFGKYSQREEILLPEINKGDKFSISKLNKLEKETQPPARFSQGSVLKEMESRGLGTKATRAQIIQILYNRGYIIGNSIEVTELGMELSEILEKNIPDVVSEKLTRHFEESMEKIETGKITKDEVLEDAKKRLIKISNAFKKNEVKIGKELTEAVIATIDKQNKLGICNSCGGTLKVHKNYLTGKRFVGCSGYPKGCRTGFPLPRLGIIYSTQKVCEHCNTPIIQVRQPGRRPFRMCLDPECSTKEEWLDKARLKQVKSDSKASSKEALKNKCPVCDKYCKSKRSFTLHMKTHNKEKLNEEKIEKPSATGKKKSVKKKTIVKKKKEKK